MATRRIVSTEKTVLEKDDVSSEGKSDISPAVPTSIIVKLLGFTAAMVILPLGAYFVTVNSIYSGNTTYAGATAALMANLVLVVYIIAAMDEDKGEPTAAELAPTPKRVVRKKDL